MIASRRVATMEAEIPRTSQKGHNIIVYYASIINLLHWFFFGKSCIMVISDVDFGVKASRLTKKFIQQRKNRCMFCKELMIYLSLQREKLDNNV